MKLTSTFTPSGAIHVRPSQSPNASREEGVNAAELPLTPAEVTLLKAFETSTALGLIALAGSALEESLGAPLRFWRGFTHRLLQTFCQLGDSGLGQWKTVSPPSFEERTLMAETAPSMVGLEYLNAQTLESVWEELKAEAILQGNKYHAGAKAWLESLHPLFHLVGRVHFHLAENKRDPEQPFGFLATYTQSLSENAKVQHLPLAQALKNYAGAGDKARLE
ncbi:MAG: hypothetical protein WCO91_12610, partial [Gemmataceae bacterium]